MLKLPLHKVNTLIEAFGEFYYVSLSKHHFDRSYYKGSHNINFIYLANCLYVEDRESLPTPGNFSAALYNVVQKSECGSSVRTKVYAIDLLAMKTIGNPLVIKGAGYMSMIDIHTHNLLSYKYWCPLTNQVYSMTLDWLDSPFFIKEPKSLY